MYLMAEFADKDSAAAAIEGLKTRGLTAGDLDVFSTEPVEFAPGVLDRPSRMSLVAVAGAATVGVGAVGFVYYTQHSYNLITGGMPTFSFWATGVVFYELAMLGAIAATFLWLLHEGGFLRRDRNAPVPVVEPGSICLRVRCDADLAETGTRLYEAGAVRVEKLK